MLDAFLSSIPLRSQMDDPRDMYALHFVFIPIIHYLCAHTMVPHADLSHS